MRKVAVLLFALLLMYPINIKAEGEKIFKIVSETGTVLTEICEEPSPDDEYMTAENHLYRIISVEDGIAFAKSCGSVELPSTAWLDSEAAVPVSASDKRIAIYCTHSDESYEPSDGYYSTRDRGSIYQVANALAAGLSDKGIRVEVADTLHHPHDAGAYRRSRQTAVQLLKTMLPDCLIDVHRDGIPDPSSYATTIGGQNVSKIRLLVGRGNQNAGINKEFALTIKAVADKVYPGLIKDIYMGKGTFNQDLLPRSILFECGTYTLEKERVLASMPMIADVLNRTLYGGVIGSAGRSISDVNGYPEVTSGITNGEPDGVTVDTEGVGGGVLFLLILLLIGILGFSVLSAGSWRRGVHKAGRNLSEMTGGLVGIKPEEDEKPEQS